MASIVSLHGMNMDPFEQSWSVIVSMELYSSDGGNLVMKSSAMHSKGCASGLGEMGNWGIGEVLVEWRSFSFLATSNSCLVGQGFWPFRGVRRCLHRE